MSPRRRLPAGIRGRGPACCSRQPTPGRRGPTRSPRSSCCGPRYWGGGRVGSRTLLAGVVVPLVVVAMRRSGRARWAAGVALLTLLLAWTTVALGGGAYTGRYTAVVVPLVALLVGRGAVALGGRWQPLLALTAVTAIGVVTGAPAAGHPRSTTAGVVAALRGAAEPGDVVAYRPDQLGPPVARELGPGYDQLVYPTLGPPQRINWVDSTKRGRTRRIRRRGPADRRPRHRAPGVRPRAPGHRTFEGDCEALLATLRERRGPAERVLAVEHGRTGPALFASPE